MLDLDYDEDSTAETDANFVLTGAGGLVEIQGTAEGAPFSEDELRSLLRLARKGIGELIELQKQAISMKLPRGTTLVVASHNQGKVREIKELLAPFAIKVLGAAELGLPEPEETEATFAGNAALKARAAASVSKCRAWPMIPVCLSRLWTARREFIRRAGPVRRKILLPR